MTACIEYRGERFKARPNGYFWGRRENGERYLHRKVWSDHNGPIPEGMVVHHRDGDKGNNEISNLTLLENGYHARQHAQKRYDDPIEYTKWLEQVKAKAETTAAAHRTSEARKNHAEANAETWKNSPVREFNCDVCGTLFSARTREFAKYCSNACKLTAARREKRYRDDPRKCAWCGKEFMGNRHRKWEVCCSVVCGNQKAGAERQMRRFLQ